MLLLGQLFKVYLISEKRSNDDAADTKTSKKKLKSMKTIKDYLKK